jgi:hypothetical protein
MIEAVPSLSKSVDNTYTNIGFTNVYVIKNTHAYGSYKLNDKYAIIAAIEGKASNRISPI